MALLFSAATVTANGEETELLVGGIPRDHDDLEGWRFFEKFVEDIGEETEVTIHAEAYLYGEGEMVMASPEEVAYMMKRMDMSPDFLQKRCSNIESVDFSFTWSPEELFGTELTQ